MTDVSRRQELVEQRVERAEATASYGLPCVLAVVAAFLPVFGYVDTGESRRSQEQTGEGATLLGLVLDPGTTGNDTAIRWTALAVPLFLALFLLTSQGDGQGSFGTESVDPATAYVLALVVPVWFLVVRSRESR